MKQNGIELADARGFAHPWDTEVFDETARDNRFLSVVTKGLLRFLDTTIRMYGKPVRHFVLQTGKEYLYQEANGYDFSWASTTGEDYPYFHKPRGVVSWEEVQIEQNQLSSPYASALYDRQAGDEVAEFQAEVRILPIQIPISLTYVLTNFNESIVMTEQLLCRFAFTRYFRVTYMGRVIDCSLEFPESITPAKTVKVSYDAETKDRQLDVKLSLKTVFPVILEATEIESSKVIASWRHDVEG